MIGAVVWDVGGVLLEWEPRHLYRTLFDDDDEMERYLRTRQWRNNSGAYAIFERGDPYVRVVEGSVTNVIGLPMETLEVRMAWLMEHS